MAELLRGEGVEGGLPAAERPDRAGAEERAGVEVRAGVEARAGVGRPTLRDAVRPALLRAAGRERGLVAAAATGFATAAGLAESLSAAAEAGAMTGLAAGGSAAAGLVELVAAGVTAARVDGEVAPVAPGVTAGVAAAAGSGEELEDVMVGAAGDGEGE